MQTLKVELENCYGIKKFKQDFDFSRCAAIAVYAPNGAMKTSLAQTFRDVVTGTPSRDRIFPTRVTIRNVADENGVAIPKDRVFVVQPYDESYEHTERTSTLLVDSALRKDYEQSLGEIETASSTFLKSLKKQSGSKKDLETEISATFTKTSDAFLQALDRVRNEVQTMPAAPFSTVRYDVIFDDKVLDFLKTEDFKTAIREYIEKYDDLLGGSTYFKKGVFNYYNASTIAKSLSDNGFFKANHSVNLKAGQSREIKTRKDLEALIDEEKGRITDDEVLKAKFRQIEDKLNKNAGLREFHDYLVENRDLLPQLANIDKFREDVWKSYFKVTIDQYSDVLEKYHASEEKLTQISTAAEAQRTQWENVLDIFNNRFHVPFKLHVKNRVAVILGQESLPVLGFSYEDGEDRASVERADLLRVLSMGEKKALYILNIIFEMEARKKSGQETLYVIDDIADSFDYKNKYAIIEYLKEMAEETWFKQLILTHNFDFFRTICTRFVGYPNCMTASKSDTDVRLESAKGIKNVFVKDWKPNFFTDPKKRIACIPFMRNLIEFTKGETDAEFVRLTSLLHWKTDTGTVTQRDLDTLFNNLFGTKGSAPDSDKKFVTLLDEAASECLKAPDGVNFENKIVLSLAIRIASEQFMVGKINDDRFVAGISTNQTPVLFKKFKGIFPGETAAIEILHSVILMTPEAIHLNSFMYEPLMDMSDGHLRRLLTKVRALN